MAVHVRRGDLVWIRRHGLAGRMASHRLLTVGGYFGPVLDELLRIVNKSVSPGSRTPHVAVYTDQKVLDKELDELQRRVPGPGR